MSSERTMIQHQSWLLSSLHMNHPGCGTGEWQIQQSGGYEQRFFFLRQWEVVTYCIYLYTGSFLVKLNRPWLQGERWKEVSKVGIVLVLYSGNVPGRKDRSIPFKVSLLSGARAGITRRPCNRSLFCITIAQSSSDISAG